MIYQRLVIPEPMAIMPQYKLAPDWGWWVQDDDELTQREKEFAESCCVGTTFFRDAYVHYHTHPEEYDPPGDGMLRNIPWYRFEKIWAANSKLGGNKIPKDQFDSIFSYLQKEAAERVAYAKSRRKLYFKWKKADDDKVVEAPKAPQVPMVASIAPPVSFAKQTGEGVVKRLLEMSEHKEAKRQRSADEPASASSSSETPKLAVPKMTLFFNMKKASGESASSANNSLVAKNANPRQMLSVPKTKSLFQN